MIVKRGKGDYSKIYRPHRPSELYGQIEIKEILGNSLEKGTVSHTYLFYGPSGTGKTTCARILGMGLLCEKGQTSEPCNKCDSCKRIQNGSLVDFYELNNADMTKIEDMRKFRDQFSTAPFGSRYKVFVFDECHRMSNETQNMLLKEVEDTHLGNYFIFCSTEFDKIIEPLRNRCMPIEFKKVERSKIRRLIEDVCKWERIRYQDDVLDSIVEEAKGMPRNALTLLQKFIELEKVDKMAVGKVESFSSNNGSNILFIAPHGVYHDDDYTDLFCKQLTDQLNSYAVINKKYQKPATVGLTKPDIEKNLANLSRWEHVNNNGQIKEEFLNPIFEARNKILKDHGEGLIIQIHGISDDHIHKAANTLPGYKSKPESLHVLIGYGQGSKQLTADANQIIKPLIKCLEGKGINAVIAPTTPIIGNDGEGKTYCGSSSRGLNQNLFVLDPGIQCIQLEIKKTGFRENERQAFNKAELLGKALSELISTRWGISAEKSKADAETKNQALPVEVEPVFEPDNEKVIVDDTQLEIRKTANLKPHPLNREIYGDPEPYDDLKTSIQKNGILTPLIISENGTIISGHRRFVGAKESGIQEVPVIVLPLCNELDIEEKLIAANIQRQKTREQIAREYAKLKVIESEKSKIRKSSAGGDRKSEKYRKSPKQNSAEPISKGESRKKASARLGISHDTAEKALKVVNSADELKAGGKTEEAIKLLDILNRKSVNSAYKKSQTSFIQLEYLPALPMLRKESKKELLKLERRARDKIKHHQNKYKFYEKRLKTVVQALKGKEKFPGWDKESIQTEDGTEVEATTPVIISASRSTDIPGIYSDWFIERLRRGYLVKRHPRNTKITEPISFSKTRLIVFWTKNPEPMFKHLDEIDKMGIGYYFQYTLNDYETDNLEPNVPSLQKRIDYFKTLSKKIGKERVVWRFDPLILTDMITKEKLVGKVHSIMSQLNGYTEKLVISFLKAGTYKKVVKNLNDPGIKYRDFSEDDKNYVAKYIGEMGKKFNIKVAACADKDNLRQHGIDRNKCIDDKLIRRAFSKDDVLMQFIGDGKGLKDTGQRELCCCIVSKDIGEYHTCLHLCRYCYANFSEKSVKKNFERISQTGEMLLPASDKPEPAMKEPTAAEHAN